MEKIRMSEDIIASFVCCEKYMVVVKLEHGTHVMPYEEWKWAYGQLHLELWKNDKRIKNEKHASKLTGNADVVYQCLNESFAHIDIITEKTGLTVSQVMAALTQLEIMGLTESTSGKRYKRI